MSRNSLKSVARLIDVATKEVPVEEDFLADLKRSIEIDVNKPSRKKPSLTFKPSGMQCKRQSYYFLSETRADEPTPTSYNFAGICNSGTDIHVRVQNYVIGMKKNGIDCEWVNIADFIELRNLNDLSVTSNTKTETKLYNHKYNMSFMCDGIVRYKGRYYILEFKTETSNKWFSRDGVDIKHYNQAIAYSLNFHLDDVIFIYIDRDMLQMKSYLFEVDEDMRAGLVEYMNDVNGYLERSIVPPKEDIPRNVCQYCMWQKNCKLEK